MKTSITRKKRAIHTGLQQFLEPPEIMEALVLFEDSYQSPANFSLRHYISELAEKLDRKSEAKKLFINVVATMNKPEKELLPDPSRAVLSYKKRKQSNGTCIRSAVELEAFQALINKWIDLTNNAVSIDIVNYVRSNLAQLNINLELRIKVSCWLVNENQPIQTRLATTEEIRKIINLFYIGFCEYLGPVEADQLLSESIKRLKTNGGAKFADVFARIL